ncbi:MAG: hypothetical protein AAF289_10465 [Cyanobacteria bacterium P01_A01_bin.135]
MIAQIKNPYDFEKVVAHYFEQQGYEVIMPPANTKGYDIELVKSLAFKETAGRSYPRTDFLQLAEYLEEHTAIDELRYQRFEN